MQYTTASGRLQWTWYKNKPNVLALLSGRLPAFVLRDVDDIGRCVPIFTFHSVEPREFEACCAHLCAAGYRTLSLDEYFRGIGGRRLPRKSVVLTFDDGLSSLWTVAFPLLERYRMQATAFVIPGLVRDRSATTPTLRDVWAGTATVADLRRDEEATDALASWTELAAMQASGVIDVQSHTMYHARTFCGRALRDFVNPDTPTDFYRNVALPITAVDGSYRYDRPKVLGQPLYSMQPFTAGHLRYVDDVALRDTCQDFVARHGGAEFFRDRRWRNVLARLVREHRRNGARSAHFESRAECIDALTEELAGSRSLIESRLGNRVRHLCLPWYTGSEQTVSVSRGTGYRTNLWGASARHLNGAHTQDPFRIGRIDNRFLFRLPGAGRLSLRQVMSNWNAAH